jgi:hypothetical protein
MTCISLQGLNLHSGEIGARVVPNPITQRNYSSESREHSQALSIPYFIPGEKREELWDVKKYETYYERKQVFFKSEEFNFP